MNELKAWQRWLLKWLFERAMGQGPHHRDNLVQIHTLLYEVCEDEFYEDNTATLRSWINECSDEAWLRVKQSGTRS